MDGALEKDGKETQYQNQNMKKLIAVIGLVLAASVINSPAQSGLDKIIKFGIGSDQAKSITLAVSPCYAPEIVVNGAKAPWGLSAAALYPVLDVAGVAQAATGVRVDWLANEFWTPSVDVTLQVPFLFLNKLEVTPFGIAGAIFPLGMGNDNGDSAGAIYGGGVGVKVWSWESGGTKGTVNLGAGVEKWTPYPGEVYRVGGAVTLKF